LKAAVCTPRFASLAVKISSTTTMEQAAPSLGLRYFGSIEMVLDVLQLAGEFRSFALGFVLNRDERFERRLVVEESRPRRPRRGPIVGSTAPFNSIQATSLS
jgi:hypothetical protein